MTRALIVGGGIGGLTTALWLQHVGVEVTVFEAVSEVKPLGVGINLLPHATKVLHQLELLDRLEATAILTRELRYHSKDGKTIWVEPRGRHAGYQTLLTAGMSRLTSVSIPVVRRSSTAGR